MSLPTIELGSMTSAERRDLLAQLLEFTASDPVPEQRDHTPGGCIPELRFELLGPLVIRYRDVDVAPSAPKMRAMLATLLINANRAVAAPALLRELWEDEPPPSAQGTLQTYVFKLRRLFRKELGLTSEYVNQELLLTHSGGYTLRVEPEQLDINEFEQLVAQGSAALREGDHERAAQHLQRSLALWRGPIIHDGQWGTQLRAYMARLEERRFYALTMRIEADLCLGRHNEMISELASLVVEHPLHESAHAMFMIALHRAGRTPAALEVYMRFRRRMMNELGIEPSTRLQALHVALLSGDPLLSDRRLATEPLLDLLTTTHS